MQKYKHSSFIHLYFDVLIFFDFFFYKFWNHFMEALVVLYVYG